MCASKGVASPASTVLLLKGTATGSCCTVLTGYALYFLSSAQATVYKCEGDKSITALYAFQDEDVSSLYHPAVVRLSVLSHVNAVTCQHCQVLCWPLSMLSLVTVVTCCVITYQCCHMSCCHLSMLSLVNAVACHSVTCQSCRMSCCHLSMLSLVILPNVLLLHFALYILHAGFHSSNLHVVSFLLSCLGM